ncbi:MAG: right-handed parallel beta-helix repeat-containing protein, partial [Planctomycetes bacterium]|nr:right-handed parallel beta-helix repeat-containing protein [Planctomycetota bacterium]
MSKPSYASMLGFVLMACAWSVDGHAASQDASATKLQAIPTYENCSLYLNGSQAAPGGLGVRYRTAAGGAWQDGHPLVVSATDPVPRGSLFGLMAGTAYEAEILRPDGTRLAATTFSTWAEQVPIARSISLDAHESAGGPLLIEQGGTPEGWIRYIAPPGFVIDGGERDTEAVLLRNAAYVILDGLTVRGGVRHGIRLSQCHDVRISGCDISGFGRVGVQDVAKDGKYYDAKGAAINYDAGICIEDCGRLTIERNWIHDPRSHANSWFFSHPAGPTAMFTRATGEVVVRWNDFVGSDRHRWNDVMEGWGNSKREGAFNRDSDIHGNYLAFANDDAIELDGGQCNVRFYGNLIQGTMCGVSTAPNLRGPSWVIANVIANLADERGLGSAGIKNGGGSTHSAGTTFFYHNTFAGQGSGISAVGFGNDRDRGLFRAVGRNNLFAITGCGIQDPYMPEGTSYDGDVFAMPWSAPGLRVTARPCGPASVEAPAALA